MTSASDLPLRDILYFDYSVLVELSCRTDDKGIPLAQWMFDHGLEKETAITALEHLCRNGPPNIEFIEWIVKSFQLKLSDIDQDGCADCIISACLNGYNDLITKMVAWFDIQSSDTCLSTGLQMIVSLVTHYMDNGALVTQREQGYPMIMWLVKTLQLKGLLPHSEAELRDLVYEASGEARPESTTEGMSSYLVDITCQLLSG